MEDDGIRRIAAMDFDVLAGGKEPSAASQARWAVKLVDSMAPQLGVRFVIFSDRPHEQEPGMRDWLNNYVTAFFSGDVELVMVDELPRRKAGWIEDMGGAQAFLVAILSHRQPRAVWLEAGIPVVIIEEPKKEATRGQARK